MIARRRLLSAIAGLSVAALLPACGGPRAERERPDNRERLRQYREELKRYAELGYRPQRNYAVESIADFWFSSTDEVAVSLTLPRDAGRYPLVVYLPGLGESATDGLLWRKAWAEAGYAVLAVQPVAAAQAWSSPQARNGDFADIVREQFSNAALAARVAALRFALAEVARQAGQGMAIFGRVDLSNIAIAGFDLGAQTAQFLAGEHLPGMEPAPALPALRAAIALSPHVAPPHIGVDPAGLAARYGDIRLPMLDITGAEDVDGYEMVTIAMVRHTPFRYMAPGDKYLLSLNQGPHRLLSGMPPAELNDSPETASLPSGRGMDGGRSGPGGGPGGPGPGGMYGPGEGGDPGGGRPDGNGPAGDREGGPGGRHSRIDTVLQIAEQERQAIAILGLSTAFLDATLRRDAAAQGWLARDAQSWLQPVASLASK